MLGVPLRASMLTSASHSSSASQRAKRKAAAPDDDKARAPLAALQPTANVPDPAAKKRVR